MVGALDVPCYAVIFVSRRGPGHDAEYAATAREMESRAATMPGFLGVESAREREGLGLTVSYWATEAALLAWKSNAVHALAQLAGRARFYEAYEVRVARVERVYGYRAPGVPTGADAPAPATLVQKMEVLAREIGDELLEMQRAAGAQIQELVLRRKGAGDLVTKADEHSHQRLLAALPALEPGLPILLEESAQHMVPSGAFFVCDELDGTINFSRGRPGWGVSLARVDGMPTHGVFYLPALNVMVSAVRGEGCFLNGEAVRLDGQRKLSDCVAGFEQNPHHDVALRRRYVDPITTRSLTSVAQACAVEAASELLRGRTDLYLNCRGAKIWDFAATTLAVCEAGGTALDLSGAPLRWNAVEMGVLMAADRGLAAECVALFEA